MTATAFYDRFERHAGGILHRIAVAWTSPGARRRAFDERGRKYLAATWRHRWSSSRGVERSGAFARRTHRF